MTRPPGWWFLWRAVRLVLWGCTACLLGQGLLAPFLPTVSASFPDTAVQAIQFTGFISLFWFATAGAVISVLLFVESFQRWYRARCWQNRLLLAADTPPFFGVVLEVFFLCWVLAQAALP